MLRTFYRLNTYPRLRNSISKWDQDKKIVWNRKLSVPRIIPNAVEPAERMDFFSNYTHIDAFETFEGIKSPPSISANVSSFLDDYALSSSVDHCGEFVKENELRNRQYRSEENQDRETLERYRESIAHLLKMGRGTGFKFIQKYALQWYEPLCSEITAEIALIREGVPSVNRNEYGPLLLLLPIDVISVITLNTVINAILRSGNEGASVVSLANIIGENIEVEFQIQIMQQRQAIKVGPESHYFKNMMEILKSNGSKLLVKKLHQKLIERESMNPWTTKEKIKLGSALLTFLLEAAKSNSGTPAFLHTMSYKSNTGKLKKLGIMKLEATLFNEMTKSEAVHSTPRYLPMLIPPNEWSRDNKTGPYLLLRSSIMRAMSPLQTRAVQTANPAIVYEGLNYLGKAKWRINSRILDITKEAIARGLTVGELPGQVNYELPSIEDFKREIDYISPPKVGALADDSGTVSSKLPKPKSPAQKDFHEKNTKYDMFKYFALDKKVKTKNSELHSLRCDLEIKIKIAEDFSNDEFYYPWNLDFRGRAYPIPPNLSHIGSDLCRGLLLFSEAKPLGPHGLFWVKVHLANLFGKNKISLDDRVAWVDGNMDKVQETVSKPLDGSLWWCEADKPFSALATCIELVDILNCSNPETYETRLPVHQDGSCNGLQHYAALGRDESGGRAVNLLPADVPQDVYTKVLEIVKRKVEEHIKMPEDPLHMNDKKRKSALFVKDVLDRKVIKQTVMTSVYGVTARGARQQVLNRLNEKFATGQISTPELDNELMAAAGYLSELTLASLNEMFSNAKNIMTWLSDCASLVSSEGQNMSWVTPLGLPVMQPYRQVKSQVVKTHLQNITLCMHNDNLPVYPQKQRSAFPPNFVHSLDASHMLLTCLRMKERNLTFSAVHDSYWTHPCDIPIMNKFVRECFIELYKKPILENLRESLVMRYPNIEFPPVPQTGSLNICDVEKSIFFFH